MKRYHLKIIVLILIFVLIASYIMKPCKSECMNSTSHVTSPLKDKMIGMAKTFGCSNYVDVGSGWYNYLISKYTEAEALSPTFKATNDDKLKLQDLTDGCLGEKGDWNSHMRDPLEHALEKNNNNKTKCAECTILKLGQKYTPVDILFSSNLVNHPRIATANSECSSCAQ
jgi:hypothetical protein